jgi:4-amino-4-deoxy-L-arabinose transferase
VDRHDTARGLPAAPRRAALLGILLVLALGFLGTRGLWEPDEGRYVEVGREMLLSGNYLVPTLNQAPHFTKPPLTYWAIAAGLRALGRNEWGARLYLAIAFVGTAWLTAGLGERLCGAPAGRWAGLVYATMLLPFAAATLVTPDTLLVLWETAALACFWRGWTAGDAGRARRWMLASWAAVGAAFLTKGPPGLLPVLIAGVFLALARRPPGGVTWRGWLSPAGLAVAVAIAAPWFLLVALTHEALGSYLVWQEGVARVLSGAHHRNSRWYMAAAVYGPTLLLGAFPWWLTLRIPRGAGRPALLAALRRLPADPSRLFLALWIALPVVVLSAASSRLPFYLLVVFPALAIAIARAGSARPAAPSRRWAAPVPPVALAAWIAVLLAVRGASAWVPAPADTRALAGSIAARLGPRPAEVVVVDERIYGLSFYLDVPVELVSTRRHGPPAYWAPEGWSAEVAELATTPRRHLFVVPARHAPSLGRALAGAPVACRDVAIARAARHLIDCEPAGRPPLRVAVRVEPAGSAGARFRAMDALQELDECCGLDRALLLREGGAAGGPREALDAYEAWPLEARGIPVDIVEPGRGLVRVGGAPTGRGPGSPVPASGAARAGAVIVYPGPAGGARAVPVAGAGRPAARWQVAVRAGCDEPPGAAARGGPGGRSEGAAPGDPAADLVLGLCPGQGAGANPAPRLVLAAGGGAGAPAPVALDARAMRRRVLVLEFTEGRLDVRLVAIATGKGELLRRIDAPAS